MRITSHSSIFTAELVALNLALKAHVRLPIIGHTGIRGNELADEAAKAALSSTVSTMKCPAFDFIPELTMHYHECGRLNGADALLINCTLSNLSSVTAVSHISLVVMLLF